ncbi:hypothetical protein HMPREF1624_03896 [Sporothrix schenckii ATCC 58251]|uniref:F-box domain-containing protein n=1 Tax=Sporothrix schenckii (strain ATCC 58251 / de Perez 2211183) TaxID=1391915 RepID=U7PY54_SPOS1|nr:hypothetical protein HMPREF1624_03896 [Sporothrix schenckii ATCC 58251]
MAPRDCFPLPGELIDAILSLLSPQDLARVTQVNRTMRAYALADRYWVGFTLQHLPERVHRHFPPSESCVPLPPHIPSYHHLYAAHEARWFLARYKIWLCGHDMVGKIVVARYDPRRGCLEGYRLLAVSRERQRRALFYPPAPNTMVHSFHPEVLLHLDRPVLKLEARHPPTNEDAAKADGAPAAAETLSSTNTNGPKIVLYQPPAPLSFGQYMENKAGHKEASTADAEDAGGDTPLPPVCPRIRPIVMDMDGDNVLLSQNNGSDGGSNGGNRRNGRGSPNGDNTGIDNIHIAMANNSSSSSFVTSSQLRRQFVYARPLTEKAAKGGGSFTRRGESAGGQAGDDDDDEVAEGAEGAQAGTPGATIDTTVIHGAHNAGGAGATLNMPADDELPIGRPPSASSPLPFPLYTVWPPPAIPSEHRVRGTGISANHYPRGAVGQPRLRSEISDRAFHMRTWMDMGAPLGGSGSSSSSGVGSGGSPMTFDALETYATIDPKHYTPTEDKVYRGIWAGDYSSHGVEFLLVHQPDDDDDDGGTSPFDPDAFPQRDDESDADHARRVHSARIHRGRLEGIKLTGDPNVPRGERSFVAPDLGDAGLDVVIDEAPFQGVRVVKSEGHIAGTGFRNDRYVESRLLLISPNQLAQYWVGFGHISFFERVDIDKFVDAIG